MGQYRLWLHHREVDHQLRGKLTKLEQELFTLQQQTHLSERVASASYADNIIIQALLTHHTQQAEKLLAQVSVRLGTAPLPAYKPERPVSTTSSSPEQAVTMPPIQRAQQRSISSALQGWGGLPNLSAQDMQESITHAKMLSSQPLLTNQQENLLPEDSSAFIDGYSPTDPQIRLPWWLRNAVQPEEDGGEQGQNPVDQQSLRTNRLVQRWFDRWGQHEQKAQEDEQAQ